MNRVDGKIVGIARERIFHRLELESKRTKLTVFTLQLNESFQEGAEVELLFKETAPILVKGDQHVLVSAANRLPVVVKEVTVGKLFAEILLESSIGEFTSILSMAVMNLFKLKKSEELTAFIKASDISLGTISNR